MRSDDARRLSPELPHDVVMLSAEGRRKRLSDMHSTMITVECIDELADSSVWSRR